MPHFLLEFFHMNRFTPKGQVGKAALIVASNPALNGMCVRLRKVNSHRRIIVSSVIASENYGIVFSREEVVAFCSSDIPQSARLDALPVQVQARISHLLFQPI
jgi:hypothetical protein